MIKAFPQIKNGAGGMSYIDGMDLRDYFAAKALQGLLANPKLQNEILKQGQSWIMASAYSFADAMMELKK